MDALLTVAGAPQPAAPAGTRNALQRNNVRFAGAGARAMVFAHGFGCDQAVWRSVAPAFEQDYLTVCFDHVGAGGSDPASYCPEKYATLDGYVQDLLDICAEAQLRDIVFVGHSVGAMIGVLAAIRAPALFDRLVLIGPSPRYLNDDGYVGGFEPGDMDELLGALENNFVNWSASMAPVIMHNPDRPELAQGLANTFCRLHPVVARQFARVTFLSDCRAVLPQVATPSLILQCSEDAIAPLAVGRYLHREIRGSALRVMAATGHCPHMSAPDETIAAIRAFL
jgi:sigma-B regulation protein RsbQ